MREFHFIPAFVIGHEAIDHDHRQLFAIAGDIRAAIMEDRSELCSKLFASFIDLARRHFAHEESILEATGFPRLASHKVYHDELLERAEDTSRKCQDHSGRAALEECFDDLMGFFVDDVVRGDLDFKAHLQEFATRAPKK